MQNSGVQYSAVQCNIVVYNTVLCNIIQWCNTVLCNAINTGQKKGRTGEAETLVFANGRVRLGMVGFIYLKCGASKLKRISIFDLKNYFYSYKSNKLYNKSVMWSS